jgi:hypothetical protein
MLYNCLAGPAVLRAATVQGNGADGAKAEDISMRSVPAVTPREVDLGALGPGEEAKGVFQLRNPGTGVVNWMAEGPDGWIPSGDGQISGSIGENLEQVSFQLLFLKEKIPGKSKAGTVILRLKWGGQSETFRKEAPLGLLREAIHFHFVAGTRTVFFSVRLSPLASAALLDVEPIRMDLGVVRPGEQISRQVLVKNRGKEQLSWKTGLAGMKGMPRLSTPPQGRYVSFLNAAANGTGNYPASGQVKEGMEITGQWAEEGGYPATRGEQSSLRYRFTGTGISLLLGKTPEGGTLSLFLDEQFITFLDTYAEGREQWDIPVVDGQPDASHLLTVVSDGGRAIIEGVRVFGRPVARGPRGWISVSPDSGMTNRETDYVNIALNTHQLVPGVYGENVFFTSNGGDTSVEVVLEVATEKQSHLLDVYRFLAGSDYLYTTNPQVEASRLQLKGYRNLGIVFRLFNSGTPGTTDFFRWFNPVKGDHFYSSDPAGGGKPLQGYLFEGPIGNIATSRLTGTRELYRWYHPKTGCHFYTTNQAGEGLAKKGYRFDGIAGFVR